MLLLLLLLQEVVGRAQGAVGEEARESGAREERGEESEAVKKDNAVCPRGSGRGERE